MRSTANKSIPPRMNLSWQKRSGGRKPVPCAAHHQRTRQRVFLSGGSFGKALFRLPAECIWRQYNKICTKSLEFVKSVYGERSAYDNERADFYLWLCFMRLRRENSSSSKRDTKKYTGYHCKSFVNNGRYHLTLSNECAILLCVLPQKGGSRS